MSNTISNTISNPGKVFKAIKRTLSKNKKSRPILGCAFLAENGDAVSTDGYRMTVIRGAWEGGGSFVVPGEVVAELAKCKTSVKTAEIADDGTLVTVTTDEGKRFSGVVPGGVYPDYMRLFGHEINAVAYLAHPEQLTAVLKEHARAKRNVRVSLAGHALTVEGSCGELPNVRIEEASDGEMSVGFNPSFLLDALATFGRSYCEIRFEGALKPAVVSDADGGAQVLVTPVKLDSAAEPKPEPKPKAAEPIEVKPEPKPKPEPKHEPKPEPKPAIMETATTVSMSALEAQMQAWAATRKNVSAYRKNAQLATPVRVEGDTRPYEAELKELGFRWARKGFWYYGPREAAAQGKEAVA